MDFIFTDVMDISGNMLGFISDVILNFNSRKVEGFVITPGNIFKKALNVKIENIVNFTSVMVVTSVNRDKSLQFGHIKNMDVVNKRGELIGLVEDILFDRDKFSIKALILSTGFINNYTRGKKILLMNDLILGDRNLLYRNENRKFEFFNSVHKLLKKEKV